jgi:hypothetical protein
MGRRRANSDGHRHAHDHQTALGDDAMLGDDDEKRLHQWLIQLKSSLRKAGSSSAGLCERPPAEIMSVRWHDSPDVLPRSQAEGVTALPANACADVVQADVNRSLYHIPEADGVRLRLRKQLREVILRSLCDPRVEPPMHYYQGMHDIATVVLNTVRRAAQQATKQRRPSATPSRENSHQGELDEAADGLEDAAVVERTTHIMSLLMVAKCRRFATRDLMPTLRLLRAVHGVIRAEALHLADLLEVSGLGPESHYATSWVITWFAHNLSEHEHLLRRIFDCTIASNSDVTIAFILAALVLRYLPDVIVERGEELFSDSMNIGELHQTLKNLPLRLLYKRRVHYHFQHNHRRGVPAGMLSAALDSGNGRTSPTNLLFDNSKPTLQKLKKREQVETLDQLLASAKQLERDYGAAVSKWMDGDETAFDPYNGPGTIENDDVLTTKAPHMGNGAVAGRRKRHPGWTRSLVVMLIPLIGVAVNYAVSYDDMFAQT